MMTGSEKAQGKSIRQTGKRIAVWSTDFSETTGQALVTRRVVEKVLPRLGPVQFFVFPPSGRPTAVLRWFLVSLRLWRDVLLRKVDVIYLVCSRSNSGFLRDFPALALSRIGVRVVVHAHGSDIVGLLKDRRISPLAQRVYRECELIVPSAHLVKEMSQFSLRALHVCENFAPEFGAPSEQKPMFEAAFTLLWNSNVMASKGVFDVMAAVKRLREMGVQIELCVIGGVLGDCELGEIPANEALATFRHDDAICYLGRVSIEQSAALVAEADAVALPSRYPTELQPLAVIQAMCAGKAIIASDIPALTATLEDYPSEWVPIHSVNAIVTALQKLVDEKTSDGQGFVASRATYAEKARKRFHPDRFDRSLENILATTIETNAKQKRFIRRDAG